MTSRIPLVWLALALLLSVSVGVSSQIHADDSPETLPYEKAKSQDLAVWRDLLRRGEYDALEKIADDLRATKSKYRNGRSRLWRMAWCGLTENFGQMKEEDYKQTFEWLDAWLKARPQSINARLVLANTYTQYAFFARGGRPAAGTPDGQLNTFAERTSAGMKMLDEIADLTKSVDNVYRRLRIDLSAGTGEKPDINLVYDSLKEDPTSLEAVTGMSVRLLPRWYGEPGELEKFADEVVRRTREQCGEMQYAVAAMTTKDHEESVTLETHTFDWKRIQQGFRDLERTYPNSREHFDDEAQFAYMADDLDAAYAALAKIGDKPDAKSWEAAQIPLGQFLQRIKPEMMAGDQTHRLLGHVDLVSAVEVVGDIVISVDWGSSVRIHDLSTGQRRGWVWLGGLSGETASIHRRTGLVTGGAFSRPGATVYNLGSGRSGNVPFSDAKVMQTAFSPVGDLLAAADEKGRIVVVDLQTGKIKHDFASEKPGQLFGLAFAPDGARLAAASGSGDLLLFDLGTGEAEPPRKVSEQGLRSVAWSEKHLAAGTAAGEIHVLEGATGMDAFTWKGDEEKIEVRSLAFSLDGGSLAIGRRAGQRDTPVKNPLLVWKIQQEKVPQPLNGHKLGVNSVRFTDDGKTLISASHDWTIRTWKVP